MNNRKEHWYFLGKYGQMISSHSKVIDAMNDIQRNNDQTPSSYKEVLEFLHHMETTIPADEKIEIAHDVNRHYRGHGPTYTALHHHCVHEAINFVKQRQIDETYNKWHQIEKYFNQFNHAIEEFAHKNGDSSIVERLRHLESILTDEINANRCYKLGGPNEPDEEPEFKGPNLNKTYYPIVLNHFIDLTKQLTKHPNEITKHEIEKSEQVLESKLKGHTVSEKLSACMSGVFGAICGFAAGAIIGGITTGGIGILPGAIIGTIGGSSSGGLFGFFHAKRQNAISEARKDKFDIVDNAGKRQAQPEQYARDTLAEIKNLIPG